MATYVNQDEFYSVLVEYRTNPTKKSKEKLGRFFLLIAQRFLNRACFINYTNDRKDEMVSEATYYMVKYMDKYDLTRTNPFAYFTKIAERAFLQELNKRKKYEKRFTNLEYIDTVDTAENVI